jgi:D-alanine transaminase/branched-chain amino acid aminotransferase
MFIYLHQQFVLAEQAVLHVSDLAIQRGYGVFDFFRVRNGVLLFVEDHLERLERSARLMHLEVPYSKEHLTNILKELVVKNKMPDAGIRIVLTGGYSPDAYQPATPNLIVMQSPLSISDSPVPKEVSIITHEYVRDLPEAKTINYSMGIWLLKKIQEQQADDVLYHQQGVVSEFPRCNFFLVTQHNEIVTPANNALKGVTRKRVLELSGFTLREGVVTLDDVRHAKEAFLTSSTKRIQAVVKIDGQAVGTGRAGEVTSALLQQLIERERAYVAERT